MTADWTRIPYEVLDRVSVRIVNGVPGINRIVYDITSKPPRHDRVGVNFQNPEVPVPQGLPGFLLPV